PSLEGSEMCIRDSLYGSAYLSAAKVVWDTDIMAVHILIQVLSAMLEGICRRGNSGPGMKTMIDTLDSAANELKTAIIEGADEKNALLRMEQGAKQGMESTAQMEAVRGRAYYQADKGVGHLDPGAVTMYYQLKTLAECMMKKC
ncbi:MAG: DAK2 domain-containing protein, partial [Oscillospiraceae bacterium]|nr:DAK2 domain-containing protein [Oscillospiraceae bacterium]